MNIEFVLLGTSALLHHNPQMVDPNFPINRQIKALTAKKKKTDEDLACIERLEWQGGIYLGECDGKLVVTQPSSKVRKCLINAARISKQGKQVERSLIMTELNVPQIYDGSDKVTSIEQELERLQTDSRFESRLSVGISGKRVMRVRPQFFPWALIVPAVFIPDAGLNFDELQRITDLAGRAERIGDNRVNGYGAFRGYVREARTGVSPIKATIEGVRDFFDKLDKEDAA